MVVAEIPLWVVHQDQEVGDAKGSSSQGFPSSAAAASSKPNWEARASESLQGLHRSQAAALYSVDWCPKHSVFATAGGDGRVRIWNGQALFLDQHRGGTYSEVDQQYHSTTDENDDDEMSSSSSSEEEGRDGSGGDNNNGSSSNPFQATGVHDLSGSVRRKKDNSKIPVSPSKQSNSNTTSDSKNNNTSAMHPPNKQRMLPPPAHNNRKKKKILYKRLVCSLSAHSGSSVLAVRFSHSGRYLASAGDDGAVCIYRPVGNYINGDDDDDDNNNNETTQNNNKQHALGQWTRVRLLRGHNLDVVGLTWSPDDAYLVSCSLDSATPIIVWKTDALEEATATTGSMIGHPYKTLGVDVHTSTVKGVAFDPAGSYLCSSGDDPAICLWRAHDDWGLERKIRDIFPSSNHNPAALTAQSLFRRIAWAADGSFVCSTNAIVKNKHVASTISRQGWRSKGEGAADLVGHKHPVVVARGAPELVRAKQPAAVTENVSDDDDDDDEDEDVVIEYATLMALGDKRGFVTVWSTKRARPVFKLQCSESRCQVTDLSWGRLSNDGVILLVSLLDGHIVALKFQVPKEIGVLLTKSEKDRVFESRYGIATGDDNGRSMLMQSSRGKSQLIESAFQMNLGAMGPPGGDIDDDDDDGMDVDDDNSNQMDDSEPAEKPAVNVLNTNLVRSRQKETTGKDGRKRVQPLLMTNVAPKKAKPPPTQPTTAPPKPPPADPMQAALDAAKKASEAAKNKQQQQPQAPTSPPAAARKATATNGKPASPSRPQPVAQTQMVMEQIPHSRRKSHSMELPEKDEEDSMDITGKKEPLTVECRNVNAVPIGSKIKAVGCIDIAISKAGKVTWRDQIPGTSCTSLSACQQLIAVGTADGCLHMYGTSSSMGWKCGMAVRSHPAVVLGHAVVSLQLAEDNASGQVKLLTLRGDGSFAIYSVIPTFSLLQKGSVLPAMTHMALSSGSGSARPKVSRIQLTETGRVLLLLSFSAETDGSLNLQSPAASSSSSRGGQVDSGVGGSLQAFSFDTNTELWIRVSDSRFLLSDFYSVLPAKSKRGPLSRTDDLVRVGSSHSSLQQSSAAAAASQNRRRAPPSEMVYQANAALGHFLPTRSHCEDRLACAVALESANEFRHWLALYARVLVAAEHEASLRVLIDQVRERGEGGGWWLESGATILGLDRTDLLKSTILPELHKNRGLQRLTNEIMTELNTTAS